MSNQPARSTPVGAGSIRSASSSPGGTASHGSSSARRSMSSWCCLRPASDGRATAGVQLTVVRRGFDTAWPCFATFHVRRSAIGSFQRKRGPGGPDLRSQRLLGLQSTKEHGGHWPSSCCMPGLLRAQFRWRPKTPKSRDLGLSWPLQLNVSMCGHTQALRPSRTPSLAVDKNQNNKRRTCCVWRVRCVLGAKPSRRRMMKP